MAVYDHFFILIIKQLVLCRKYKENLHTDKLAGAERVKLNISPFISFFGSYGLMNLV